MKKYFLVWTILTCTGVLSEINISPTLPNQDMNVEESTVAFSGVWNSTILKTVLLPKCCSYSYAVGLGNCMETSVDFQPTFDVHDHNETAFDDVPIDKSFINFQTYIHNPCSGRKFPLSPDESPKILLNGSLLVAGMLEYDGILNHDQFCVDNLKDDENATDDTVYAFICIKDIRDGFPRWVFTTYISLITISALLFTTSAVFFYRQDVQAVHKKSFMSYALSMSGTYFIVILIQFISGYCTLIGLLLQFFIILSFAWLTVLCFDLAWMIHFYQTKENLDRFVIYVASCMCYSILFIIISLTNNFEPDMPGSFFKPQFQKNTCADTSAGQRNARFFAALIICLVLSAISLLYCLLKMNQFRYRNTSEGVIQWKKVSKKFRYMFFQCLLVLKTAIISLVPDVLSYYFELSEGVAVFLLFLQGIQGLFVVAIASSFWHYMQEPDDESDGEIDITFQLLRRKNFDLI